VPAIVVASAVVVVIVALVVVDIRHGRRRGFGRRSPPVVAVVVRLIVIIVTVVTPAEALGIVKRMASASFDESVDVAVRLGVEARKADQLVRGTVALPSGTGKDVRVAVFAAGAAAQEAREAGADLIGADDLAAQVEARKFDFDVVIATPDMMPSSAASAAPSAPAG
jgi:hypothetical protein